MEESEETSEAIAAQRDDERERRRMRDRQRRQSMTVEQRERHLARRRRNYQLRRLRAETCNSKLDIVEPHEPGFESEGEIVISTENHGINLAPEISIQNHGFDSVGLEKIDSAFLQSIGQETLYNKSIDVAKTLRLSRLRCLARSLDNARCGVGEDPLNVAEVRPKNSPETTHDGSGRLPGGIRLSRFKRLARGLDTAIDETSNQAKQDLIQEEAPVVSCGMPMFGEPTIDGGESKSAL